MSTNRYTDTNETFRTERNEGDITAKLNQDRAVVGLLVDSEIVLSTRYGKDMVFINKTLSTQTS
jgi:hypothetical protein